MGRPAAPTTTPGTCSPSWSGSPRSPGTWAGSTRARPIWRCSSMMPSTNRVLRTTRRAAPVWRLRGCSRRALGSALDPAKVEHLVRLTARHGHLQPSDVTSEEALFLDCDLAILGAPTAEFDRYEADVAREYASLPEEVYVAGRRAFLEQLLQRERRFLSPYFHARRDRAACANLAHPGAPRGRSGLRGKGRGVCPGGLHRPRKETSGGGEDRAVLGQPQRLHQRGVQPQPRQALGVHGDGEAAGGDLVAEELTELRLIAPQSARWGAPRLREWANSSGRSPCPSRGGQR